MMKRKLKPLLILLSLFATMQGKAQVISGQLQNTNGVAVPITFWDGDTTVAVYDTTDANGYYTTRVFDLYSGVIRGEFLNCNSVLVDSIFTVKMTYTMWSPDYCSPVTPPPPCPVSFTSSFCTCDKSFYLELDTTGLGNKILEWNFGDGNSSNEKFPTHYYSSNEMYDVCVTVVDSGLSLCNFCHHIGFDSTGHLFTRKESEGFKITTVLPGQVPTETPSVNLSIYPNPAGDKAQVILFSDEESICDLKILNLVGQQIQSIHKKTESGYNQLDLDLSNMQSGAYMLFVQLNDKNYSKLFVK